MGGERGEEGEGGRMRAWVLTHGRGGGRRGGGREDEGLGNGCCHMGREGGEEGEGGRMRA